MFVSNGNNAFESAAPADEVRRRRLVALLDDHAGWQERLERVCVVTVGLVGVDGAAVTVMGSVRAGLDGHRDQLAATGPLSRRLEDLQLTAGEGPCMDAFRDGRPVLIADLAGEPSRWLGFGSEASAAGVSAVFSLPLQVGAIRLGTFDLHRRSAGPLSHEQLADALAMASLATEALLELAEQGSAPEPGGGREVAAGWLPDVHADVHAASGMVSAQTGSDVRSALLRIRAHAFGNGEPIHEVARRIIDRDLTFPLPDDCSGHGPTAPDEEGEL
jgi:GAF domain-containing protein